jgi:hypothetical protein
MMSVSYERFGHFILSTEYLVPRPEFCRAQGYAAI